MSEIDTVHSRAGSPTGSCVSESRGELLNLVSGFGSKSKKAQKLEGSDHLLGTSLYQLQSSFY